MTIIETSITEDCEADDGKYLNFKIVDRSSRVTVTIHNGGIKCQITMEYYTLSRAIENLDSHQKLLYK